MYKREGINKVLLAGAGAMGSSFAQIFAKTGYEVILYDIAEGYRVHGLAQAGLHRHGHPCALLHGLHDLAASVRVPHERGSGAAAEDLRDRASHVDVEEVDVRVHPECHLRRIRHPLRIASEELEAGGMVRAEPDVHGCGPVAIMDDPHGGGELGDGSGHAERLHEVSVAGEGEA